MKAGTAQKIVLNLFSTLVMIRLGRVYRGADGAHARHQRQAAPSQRRHGGAHRRLRRGGRRAMRSPQPTATSSSPRSWSSASSAPLAQAILARNGGNLRAALADIAAARTAKSGRADGPARRIGAAAVRTAARRPWRPRSPMRRRPPPPSCAEFAAVRRAERPLADASAGICAGRVVPVRGDLRPGQLQPRRASTCAT